VTTRISTRALTTFILTVGILLVPGLLLTAIGHPQVATVATMATISAMVPALMASTRLTWLVVLVLVPASMVAITASASAWLAAALMAALAVLTGVTARVSAQGVVTMMPISVIFLMATPPSDSSGMPVSAYAVGAVVAAAAVWAVVGVRLLQRLLKASPHAPVRSMTLPWSRTLLYALMLVLTLGIGGWFVVELQLQHGGAWFLMTFVLILQPYAQDSSRKTLERVTGTVLGVALAMVVFGIFQEVPIVLYVLAVGSVTTATILRYVLHHPYWQYVLFLTPTIIIMDGLGTSMSGTALSRLGFTLLAAAVALAIEAALRPAFRRTARLNNEQKY